MTIFWFKRPTAPCRAVCGIATGFNAQRFDDEGQLFRGRYKAIQVEEDHDLLVVAAL